jgi:uroporphyrinogen decarboxylase
MNPFDLHERFGDKLVLDGTIGTQTVMPFGSADDVEDTVRQTIERCGRAGGLILSPTHILEPEVPIENIEALFNACATYGNGA